MNDRAPKVFVVYENPDLNLTDAEQYGEITFVTARSWNPRRGSLANTEVVEAINRKIHAEFDPRRDYVILNGPPVIMGYAFAGFMRITAWANVNMGLDLSGFNILSWDRVSQKYILGVAELTAANNG